jgi:hypothetical protein
MTLDQLRALERIHAVLSWTATASLVVCAVAWARLGRARLGAAVVAALVLISAAGTGLALEEPFRFRLRQRLFLANAALGWLFERKQHAAFASFALGLSAALALAAARRRTVDHREVDCERPGRLALTASAFFALFACVVSVLAARRVAF